MMGDVRAATSYSSAAKTKAVALFTDLYHQANNETRLILDEFVNQLNWILKRKLMFASTKNKLCLLLLNDIRTKLETAAKEQPAITVRIKKLIATTYTAINPTLGDFWRMVRTTAAITGSIAAALYLGHQIYRMKTVIENESGPFNQMVSILNDIHKRKDEKGDSELANFLVAMRKNLESTEEGSFGRLMIILQKIHDEKPELLPELTDTIHRTMNDTREGSFAGFVKILNKIPTPLLNGSITPLLAYLNWQTPK